MDLVSQLARRPGLDCAGCWSYKEKGYQQLEQLPSRVAGTNREQDGQTNFFPQGKQDSIARETGWCW